MSFLFVLAAAIAQDTPDFAQDIAPLVHRSCAPCHHDGGSAPFPLLTYEEIQRRARQIGVVTESRLMPPWKPVPGYGEFADSRRLPDEDLARIQAWIAAGAPEGDAAVAPPPPEFTTEWALGEPDLVLEPTEAFEVPAEGFDVWRCFVLPTGLEGDHWVRAVEIRPSNPRVVHHVIMYPDDTGRARELDAADPRVGYEDMFGETLEIGGQMSGWVPGWTARPLPEGAAWLMTEGTDLVIDNHFQTTGKPEKERTQVGLWFADVPPERPITHVRMGAGGINIPPGKRDYVLRDRLVLPVDVRAFGILPHAHYVCQRVDCWATLPGSDLKEGARLPLVRIEDWDFNWQDLYRFAQPIDLPAGTVIEMEFTYDNSSANPRNPSSPPRRIVGGSRTRDEMAALWLQVTVESDEELATLVQSAYDHDRAVAKDALRLETYWTYVIAQFDADANGWLDDAEEEAAAAFIEAFRSDEEMLLGAFDLDANGELGEDERAYSEWVARLWGGESPTPP